MDTTHLKKWTLISKTDVSQTLFFPIEKRVYTMPNGKVIDDFYVSTLADSAHVVAVTEDKKIVMIRMYKQGADDVIIQFPAGRLEKKHKSLEELAIHELAEETGIIVSPEQLRYVGKTTVNSTKLTEQAHLYLATHVQLGGMQHLEETEEIEILLFTPKEIDHLIAEGVIWDAVAIANWSLVKMKCGEAIGE